MNILIPDSWLKDFLKTEVNAKKLGQTLSLAGPSIEKIEKQANDWLYHVEITTNRIDTASVYGLAREAHAILSRFALKSKFAPLTPKAKPAFVKSVDYLQAEVDHRLCPRFTAVLIKNVTIGPSPKLIQERLKKVGERPINNVVDISNYIMHEIGQPLHTFDYDKIKGAKMILRKSRPGEKITTLDGKTHELPGEDIVIEDGAGRLIDLAGIMGGAESAVDKNTKNVLLFVQTYNPVHIRRTSMKLAKRTQAAVLFEKSLDPELVSLGLRRGLDLFVELTKGTPVNKVLDLYPKPYKSIKIKTSHDFINERLGIKLPKQEIAKYLNLLGFENRWRGHHLEILVPSFRAGDITIPEDIVEEVARLYGYHNLPSQIMAGQIPEPLPDSPFKFEYQLKTLLYAMGGVEVYTFSLVPEEFTQKALKIKNPLGLESAYLRTSLQPSLVEAADKNLGQLEPFHLFEIANVYLPHRGKLPEEKMVLAGIMSGLSFRQAKGIIETLLKRLNLSPTFKPEDKKGFLASGRLSIRFNNHELGEFGILERQEYLYYEFEVESLRKWHQPYPAYQPLPKYPAQIEDLTLILPERCRAGEVLDFILAFHQAITKAKLIDIYQDAHTFRLWYQDRTKTLTDKEVEVIRVKLLSELEKKFGAVLKT